MKRVLAPALAALALTACSDASRSPDATAPTQVQALTAPYYTKGTNAVDGDYIVVFNDDVADPVGKADEKVLKHNGKTKFKYENALKGFAATLSAQAVVALQADPDVKYIEQDQTVTISTDRKSTRLNSSHPRLSRMPSSA